jgi:hypothetical protein
MLVVHEHEMHGSIARHIREVAQRALEEFLERVVGHLAARHLEFRMTNPSTTGRGIAGNSSVVRGICYAAVNRT